jgi:hypothetical protein
MFEIAICRALSWGVCGLGLHRRLCLLNVVGHGGETICFQKLEVETEKRRKINPLNDTLDDSALLLYCQCPDIICLSSFPLHHAKSHG